MKLFIMQSSVQIFSPAPSSQTPSIYAPPLEWETSLRSIQNTQN